MDRLLRRYAGRGVDALRAKSGELADVSAGAHLDADEMNAYAEGALPEAARSRYFAHLADCDGCRKLVTELTLAASRAGEGKARAESLAPTPSKSWRERLAVIFSPPVLRYGVPALALFAVIVVAIVAMRTNRKESGVALNTEQSRYAQPTTTTDSNSAMEVNQETVAAGNHANSNAAPLAVPQDQQTQPDAAATPMPSADTAQREENAPVVSQSKIPGSERTEADATKDTLSEFEVKTKREQLEVAAAPAAPPPAAQKTTDSTATAGSAADRRDNQQEQKKNKVAAKADDDEMVADGRSSSGTAATQRTANEARTEIGKTTSARAPQGESRKRSSTAIKSGPAATASISEKEGSTETRSVGGRRFRRQGSAWVDTSYSSSRQTTNVARGSEQYRALVADEPALRTIAEQLGGEVFVVWKSRAYRFY